MNNNELQVVITAGLDEKRSIAKINRDIEVIEKKLKNLKLQASLDSSKSKAEIQKQIENLNRQKKKLYVDLQLRKDTLKKQYQELQKSNLKLNVDTSTAEKNIKNVGNTITSTTNETAKLGVTLKNTLSDFGLTISARAALELIRKAANEATAAVREYDEYTKNLKIITNKNDVSDLIADYATKSIDMKVSIGEYEQASEVILRAGKNLSESAEYTDTAIKLAKTGFIETDKAAENLITIANSYDLTADKLKNVTDTLLILDVQTNTEAGALSSAMAKSAKNAQLAGLSYEQLGATIAKLKDTTGKSETEIATSLNNIFNRTYRVKPNTFTFENENGETEDLSKPLSDVEKVANQLGISIRKSATEFKDFEEIISTIAPIWKDLDSVSQNALSSVFAGQHKNVFLNLVNDWQEIVELTKTAENSFNATETKYTAYLDSLEAKSAEFSTVAKEMWNHLIPEGFVGDLTEAGTATLKFVDDYKVLQTALKSATFYALAKGAIAAKNSLSGMIKDIKNISYAMDLASKGSSLTSQQFNSLGISLKGLSDSQQKLILSTKSLTEVDRINLLQLTGLEEAEAKAKLQTLGLSQANQTATVSTFSLSGAFKSLWAVIAANPVMALTVAVAGIATIYQTVQRKNEEMRESAKDLAKELNEQAQALDDLRQKYIDICDSEDSTSKKTEELNEWKKTLIETYGLEKNAIEQVNLAREDGLKLIDDEITKQNRENRGNWFGKNENQFNKAMRTINDINYSSDIDGIIKTSIFKSIDANEVRKSVKDLFNNVYEVGAEGNWQFEVFGNNLIEKYENIQKIISELGNSKNLNFSEQNLLDGLNKESENIKKILDNYQEIYETGYNFKAKNYFEDYASNNPIENIGKNTYLAWKKGLISTAGDDIQLEKELMSLAEKQFPDYQKYFDNLETAKDKFVVGKVNSKPISDFINSLSDDDLSILIQLDTNVFKNGIEGAEQAIEDFKNDPDNQISVDVETGDTSSLDDLEKSYEELSKFADSLTKSQKTLTDALKEQKEHGQLSADTIKSLSEAGYSQALAVDKETGAVTLNMEAYNRLNEQKRLKIKLDIEQQNTELETKLKEEESAISSLKTEYEALTKANKEANEERLKAIEIELAQRSQNKAKLQDLVNKNNSVSVSLDAPTFDNSSTKTDSWKEEAEKKFADLEHLYAMDKISYASYLSQLDKLNQYYYGNKEKYLDEFRKNEEKIYQGRKKLNEDLIAEEAKQQKAYHDKRISELETQITVTEKHSVDSDGNSLGIADKFDHIRSIYDEILSEIERRENEIVQSGVEGHEDELAELVKQYENYANKKADIFNDEIQYEMDYISELEEKYNDFVDKRIKHYENEMDIVKDRYDAEIKSIDDTIDALKDKNDETKAAIDLKKAEQDLENAKQRTRKVYGADGTVTYRQDTDKIEEAQQKADDLKLDILIDSLEQQKKDKETEKDAALEKYDTMIKDLEAQKESQDNFFDKTLDRLDNSVNPKPAENLDRAVESVSDNKKEADNTNQTLKDITKIVENSNNKSDDNTVKKASLSKIETKSANDSKDNVQIEQTSNYESFMKLLYNMAGKEPDAYERYKRGEYDEGNKLMADIFSDDAFINRAKKPFEDAITSFNETITKSSITNIEKQQPVNVTFSGGINIQNPVGEVEQFAKELMLQLPTAFNRQIYTNLKY